MGPTMLAVSNPSGPAALRSVETTVAALANCELTKYKALDALGLNR